RKGHCAYFVTHLSSSAQRPSHKLSGATRATETAARGVLRRENGRLLARRPSGRLSQSALRGARAFCEGILKAAHKGLRGLRPTWKPRCSSWDNRWPDVFSCIAVYCRGERAREYSLWFAPHAGEYLRVARNRSSA